MTNAAAPDELEPLLQQIYIAAYRKVAALQCVYQVRGLKPGDYVQKLPSFDSEADFDLFKQDPRFSEQIALFSLREYRAYVAAIQQLLKSRGYDSLLVPLTQKSFLDYLDKQEELPGAQ